MLTKAKVIKGGAALIILFTSGMLTLSGAKQELSAAEAAVHVSTIAVNDVVESKNNASISTADVITKGTVGDTSEAAPLEKDVQAIDAKGDLNDYVLKVINQYKGNKYPYLLNDDYENYNGVTQNIVYKGSLIAKANPDGSKSSHCVGLTYEVFFIAMQQRNKDAGISQNNFNNMSADNMKDFLLTWYAAKGTPKTEGDQLAGALVKYGLGVLIKSLEEAKSGDFIDFSRTKSGHTAVFINWMRNDAGKIVGFKYWSTQESTHGISYKVEYFSDNNEQAFIGTVNRNQLYIGRVGPIKKYKAF